MPNTFSGCFQKEAKAASHKRKKLRVAAFSQDPEFFRFLKRSRYEKSQRCKRNRKEAFLAGHDHLTQLYDIGNRQKLILIQVAGSHLLIRMASADNDLAQLHNVGDGDRAVVVHIAEANLLLRALPPLTRVITLIE